MSSSGKFRIRLATAQDYAAVLDINRNVYMGFDYVPAMYFYFVHHPDILLFVAELDGKVVGFSGYYLTDNRTAAVSIAARVDPAVQGQRVMDRMVEAKETFLRRYLANRFHIRVVEVYNSKVHLAGRNHLVPKLKIVNEMHHIAYNVSPTEMYSKLPIIESKLTSSPAVTYDLATTMHLLQKPSTLELMSESGHLMLAHAMWLPLQVDAANARHVAMQCNQVYFAMRDGRCVGFSFCDSLVMARDALRLNVFYYGVNDVSNVTSHVCAFLRHSEVSVREYAECYVVLHFPYAMNADDVDAALIPALGPRYLGGPDFTTTGSIISETREKLLPISKL